MRKSEIIEYLKELVEYENEIGGDYDELSFGVCQILEMATRGREKK